MLLPDRDDRKCTLHRPLRAGTQPVRLDRRAALAGAASLALFAPSIARAQSARRVYRLERGGSDIGSQSLTVTRSGGEIVVDIDIDLRVSLLGITAYRYEMTNQERWSGGAVQSIRSNTNNDGEREFVEARRTGAGLEISGSGFSGTLTGTVGTTTYWTPAMMRRPQWVNTQDGSTLNIVASRRGSAQYPTATGTVSTAVWSLGSDLPLILYYTDAGEWAGSTFDAQGEEVRYIAQSLAPSLGPIWSES
ncbi:DUF6134 family protein [Pontivivens insulae]|uniref:DUF3108 domain-containing protein n=1 Tax=Pontivivens insulae TaxID=1639689 RepID=A0A2R8ACV3_9RHOB|nr:DUF6134 family protein [Pontivivens insulae]RED13985.1 hypothetical protein DFR53_1336 [Pontivivens insulae]SPF30059.1 hypothetical protein POI8812_02389 [Pontivivens insulae]